MKKSFFLRVKNSMIGKAGIYVIFKVVGYVAALASVKLLTNSFATDGYGELSLAESNVSLLASLFVFGLPQAYIRYFYQEKKKENLSQYDFTYTVVSVIISAVGIATSFIVFRIGYGYDTSLVIYLTEFMLFEVLSQHRVSMLRGRGKVYMHSTILAISEVMGYFLPILMVFIINMDIETYFRGKAISVLVILVIALFMTRKYFSFSKVDWKMAFSIVKFGAPLLLLNVGVSLFGNYDRIVADQLFGTEMVAYYTVPSKVAHVVQQIIVYPLNMVLFPMYMKMWEEKGREETEKLLSAAFDVYIFIAIPILVETLNLSKEMISIFSKEEYCLYWGVLPILLTSLLIYGSYYFIAAGFFVKSRTVLLGVIMCFSAGLNIVLNYVLGSEVGIFGIAYATGIAYIVFLFLCYIFSKKVIKVTCSINRVLYGLTSGAIMLVILMGCCYELTGWARIAVSAIVGIIAYGLLNLRYIKLILGRMKNVAE